MDGPARATTNMSAAPLAFGLLLIAVLVPVTVIDVRERRIPNAITGPAAIAAIVIGAALDPSGQPARLVAAVGAVAFLVVTGAIRPGGLGMGDVKLAGVLGLCLGPVVAVSLAAAFAAGSVVAVAVGLRGGRRALRTTTVPFGPYLAGGGVAALIAGDPLLAAYVGVLQA